MMRQLSKAIILTLFGSDYDVKVEVPLWTTDP